MNIDVKFVVRSSKIGRDMIDDVVRRTTAAAPAHECESALF
jgi:hypothetical protein